MTPAISDYHTLLAEAGRFHGQACHGIQIGTRMTMSGLGRIGIADPKGEDRGKLVVIVEIDRCPTDAIMALTGCRPGKRTLKVRDYGKMAATFVNLETGKAVRVAVRGQNSAGSGQNDNHQEVAALAEEELFTITEVDVPLRPEDLPGKARLRVPCARCGEEVLDGREVQGQEGSLCLPCSRQVLA